MKVLSFKKLSMDWPPVRKGETVCMKNQAFLHAATPEHQCTLELEEVEMAEEEYVKIMKEETDKVQKGDI